MSAIDTVVSHGFLKTFTILWCVWMTGCGIALFLVKDA